MRVGHLLPGRAGWFDRNPIARYQSFNSLALAPAAQTILWTYTVPVGKKAWLASVQVSLSVRTMPTVGSFGWAAIGVMDTGIFYPISRVFLFNTVPGASEYETTGVAWMMPSGLAVQAVWEQLSVGGAYEVNLAASLTEFDA